MTRFSSPTILALRAVLSCGGRRTLVLAAGALLAVQVQAQAPATAPVAAPKTAAGSSVASVPPDAHARADIERHRAMAKAHEAAAQCLASGAGHESCEKQLQSDCKGLALGKHCGMRHAH